MREIEFRGKDLNGVWRYGSLANNVFFYSDTKKPVPYIIDVQNVDYFCLADLEDDEGFYETRPETVGQFTGISDKNGRRIYEGDVVKHIKGLVKNEQGQFVDDFEIEVVKFEYAGFSIGHLALIKDLEVIGNIHDNPELLEHGSQN